MGFPTLGHSRYKFPSLRALIMLEESKKNTVVVSTNYTSPVPGRATASASSSSCSQSENSCCGTSSSNKEDEEDVNVDLTEQKKANDTQELRLVLFLVLKDEHEMCARTIYYTNIDNKTCKDVCLKLKSFVFSCVMLGSLMMLLLSFALR
ncbi:hypothetical protein DY000_02014801 [Brassica cretica]|uniref:FLZ-type domain-containing protein n=1 Tax=Brassica cretica TaxID=69181 RepID=A0ABQ7D7D2_BRACR|nr:hypothetical protein DY000_02014801 [Brassica cretica]